MTGEILLQIVMAMIGALGFGLLFHISGSRLITIMLGAAVNWGVYLLAMQWYDNRVTAFFVATLATAALDEVLARLLKAPVITLLVPMLVPLIPGGDLYDACARAATRQALLDTVRCSSRRRARWRLASSLWRAWCRLSASCGCCTAKENKRQHRYAVLPQSVKKYYFNFYASCGSTSHKINLRSKFANQGHVSRNLYKGRKMCRRAVFLRYSLSVVSGEDARKTLVFRQPQATPLCGIA